MAEPTAEERKAYAKAGYSMPDGSYYIRDGAEGVSDLENAIKAVGRTTNAAGEIAANAVRRHIMTRASALKRTDLIPATWNSDGSLKHADAEEFVAHFGVKGMHWGVRKETSDSASEDARRAGELNSRVRQHGTKNLSNEELQHLVTRMNLVQQHTRLSGMDKSHVDRGEAFIRRTVSLGKLGLDAVETGKRVQKLAS